MCEWGLFVWFGGLGVVRVERKERFGKRRVWVATALYSAWCKASVFLHLLHSDKSKCHFVCNPSPPPLKPKYTELTRLRLRPQVRRVVNLPAILPCAPGTGLARLYHHLQQHGVA